MKRLNWSVCAVALVLFLGGSVMAEDAKTVTGKTSCSGCSGVSAGCGLMVTDSEGVRWVLTGDSDSYKAAMSGRKGSKTITATLAGEPVTKQGKDGKDYKEVKVSEVKVNET